MQWRQERVEAAKQRSDVQLAALVHASGGPDAVTFLSASLDEQVLWLASMELRAQWRQEAAEQAGE